MNLKRRLSILLVAYLAYEFLAGILFVSYRVESSSMTPTLSPGDYIIASPLAYGPRSALFRKPLPGITDPKRGDIVVVEAPYYERSPWYMEVAESLVRFVSFQRIGIEAGKGKISGISVKRVVAVPGDSLIMKNNEVKVRVAGSDHYLTEYEVSGIVYDAHSESVPEGWPESFPLSGSLSETVLKKGEYFVVGDNRTGAIDSRAFGPVARSRFVARVLLRYWPVRNFGKP